MAKPLLLLGVGALVVTSCGLVGSDQAEIQASLGEAPSGATTTAQSSLLPEASQQPTLEDRPVLEVLQAADQTGESTESSTTPASTTQSTAIQTTAIQTTLASTTQSEPASTTTRATTPVSSTTKPSTSEPQSTLALPSTTLPSTTLPSTTLPSTTTKPTAPDPSTSSSTPTRPGSGLTYKGVVAGGDNEITAFDNARKAVKGLFVASGVQAGNLVELSRQTSEQVNGVRPTTVAEIEQAMLGLNIGEGDACILFLTSHGNKHSWFIRGSNGLTPDKLDEILSASCGSRPTVALISACYSGIFVNPLARPNRIVLTAASPTNTSFGCAPEATYTYWDGCLITHFAQAATWEDLYRRVTGCIESKESAAAVTPSRPQAHFGAEVANMPILNR